MKVFLHLPKTAGTTLIRIFERVYGRSHVLFDQNSYYDNQVLTDAFLAESAEQQAATHVIGGHIFFGIHELLPNNPTYFTFLRDPCERTISAYYYLRSNPDSEWHQIIRDHSYTLIDFLHSDGVKGSDNLMTRMISGYKNAAGETVPFRPNAPELLEQAKKNLKDHFCFIGITEDFTTSLVLMKRQFEWNRVPLFLSQNVTQDRPLWNGLKPDEHAVLEEYNRLDIELYRYGKQLYQEQLDKQGLSFWEEVKDLKERLAELNGIVSDQAQGFTKELLHTRHELQMSQKTLQEYQSRLETGWLPALKRPHVITARTVALLNKPIKVPWNRVGTKKAPDQNSNTPRKQDQ